MDIQNIQELMAQAYRRHDECTALIYEEQLWLLSEGL